MSINCYVDKLLGKRKRVGWFITIDVVVCRDNGCVTTVKGNNDDEWSSDGVVRWLGRKQNRDTIE
jgi:hypothetical protein